MTLADVPAVMAIEAGSFPMPWPERAYRYELSDNPNAYCVVAVAEDGLIAGYAVMWMMADEAHVGTIASAPIRRRQGVGERLMIDLMREAARRAAIFVTLEVRVGNTAAQRLYLKYGFVEVGRRKRYYPNNREDALLMTVEDFRDPACAKRVDALERNLE
ncbi:MAG: ribosomal protein S18-alanine N-acetyltransferase [Thermoflexales bacterium]